MSKESEAQEMATAQKVLPDGYAMVPPGTPRAENYKYWGSHYQMWCDGWPGATGMKSTTWKIANPIQAIKLEDIVAVESSKSPVTNGPIQAQNVSKSPDYATLDERNEALKHLPEGYALEPRGGSRKEGHLYWSNASQMWEPGCGEPGTPIPEGMLVANKLPPNYPPERSEESVAGPGDDFELPPGYVRVPTGGKKAFEVKPAAQPPKSGERVKIPKGFEVVYGKTPKIHLFRDEHRWRVGPRSSEGMPIRPGQAILKPINGGWEALLVGYPEGSAFCPVEYGQPKSGEPRYWVVKEGDSALVAGTLVELTSQEQFREVVCGDTKYILSLSELEPVELDAMRQKEFEKAVGEIKNLKLPESVRQILYTALLNIVRIGR